MSSASNDDPKAVDRLETGVGVMDVWYLSVDTGVSDTDMVDMDLTDRCLGPTGSALEVGPIAAGDAAWAGRGHM